MSIISRIKNRLTKPVNHEQRGYDDAMQKLCAGEWTVAEIQVVVDRVDVILECRTLPENHDNEIEQRRDGMLRAASVFLAKGLAA